MSTMHPLSASDVRPAQAANDLTPPAGFGPALALTVTLAIATFLIIMALVLLVVHPETKGLGAFAPLVNQQNQKAKTFLYAVAFVVILPVALVTVPRVADLIVATPNTSGLPLLAAIVPGSFAALLIGLRVLGSHGVRALLAAVVVWSAAVAAGLARAASRRPWPALLGWSSRARAAPLTAGAAVFGLLLAVTSAGSLHLLPLGLGALLAIAVLAGATYAGRRPPPRLSRRAGHAVDMVLAMVLLLAIPNLVIFHTTGRLPSIYLPPGVYQNQQDYLLGSVNQLLGGGALLVNVPTSQYGVGLVYFLAGWFHLAPIGYGTLGALDGILTALFYLAGYGILRLAGVTRLLAASALAVGVVALVYGLRSPVGALPETGPLRFGLPIGLVLTRVAAARWASRARAAEAASFCVVGLAAIWAFEAFTYTVVVFAAIAAVHAWLRPAGRRRWLIRQAALAIAASVVAHLLLAAATVAGTGQLPDWTQYLAYLRSFLLGGEAGAISYGFARWSPGLAFAGAVLASAAALVLLLRRAPHVCRDRPAMVIALTGAISYAVALLSYVDSRSSTYLLPYVALPLLLAGVLWLALLREVDRGASRRASTGALALALAVSVLMVAAAWPFVGSNLSETALARAYPGGGMRSALHRLWHPPPIDPRALEGERLLRRYIPGKRVLILLPTVPDLGVEILMRSGRVNSMFIGDPVDDSLVFSAWKSRLTRELTELAPGQRLLVDRTAFEVIARLLSHPSIDPSVRPILGGDQEIEWLLREIDRRFALRPMVRAPSGLIVAELVARRS